MALAPSEVESRRTSCGGKGKISWPKLSDDAPLITLIRKTERLIKTDFRMVLYHRNKLVVKLKASGVIKQASCAKDWKTLAEADRLRATMMSESSETTCEMIMSHQRVCNSVLGAQLGVLNLSMPPITLTQHPASTMLPI